ncbi:MAG: CHAT domain-containing protein [Calditrichaeota bacterium]|nr:MAG: CHAT domain-containing protein [Calditrichota bacterium]
MRLLGNIALDDKNFEKARFYFNLILEKNPENSYAIGRYARSYYFEKQYQKAKQLYRQALSGMAENHLNYPWYTLRQGEVALALGNVTHASEKLQTALAIGKEKQDTELLWEVYFALGRLFMKQAQLPQAIAAFHHAATNMENNRRKITIDELRIGYFEEGSAIYKHLAEAYFQRFQENRHAADLDSTVYFSSHTRGRSLHEAIQEQRAQTAFLQTSAEAAGFREMHKKVATTHYRLRLSFLDTVKTPDAVYTALETDRIDLLSQKLRALEAMPAVDSTKKNQKTDFFAMDSLQAILHKQQAALLLYHISNRQSFVSAISADTVLALPLRARADSVDAAMATLLNPFYSITSDNVDSLKFRADIAYGFYTSLLEPVLSTVNLPSNLIIVPDNHLAGLPFSLLLRRQPAMQAYGLEDSVECMDGFLLHDFVFSYSPSFSTLLRPRPEQKARRDMLVFADPANQSLYDLDAFKKSLRYQMSRKWFYDPLPSALDEAAALQQLGLDTEVLVRNAGTENALFEKYTDFRILHFATHGFIDSVFNEFSGVVLALDSDSTRDGLLMGFEFANLNLTQDLVTLGACESGSGRNTTGEGILGLPRIILTAGARSVLQTQWKIDDDFAGRLLPVFYDNYFNGKMNKAQALAVAKRSVVDMKDKHSHPFFWAAYTLYGDAQRNVPGWFERNMTTLIAVVLSFGIITLLSIAFIRNRRAHAKFRK